MQHQLLKTYFKDFTATNKPITYRIQLFIATLFDSRGHCHSNTKAGTLSPSTECLHLLEQVNAAVGARRG